MNIFYKKYEIEYHGFFIKFEFYSRKRYFLPYNINFLLKNISSLLICEKTDELSKIDVFPLDHVCIIKFDGKMFVFIGPENSIPVYYRKSNDNYIVAVDNIFKIKRIDDQLCIDYFHYFISNIHKSGTPNRKVGNYTPFRSIKRLPLNSITLFREQYIKTQKVNRKPSTESYSSVENAVEEAKDSLSTEIKQIAKLYKCIATEASGGIDSGIAFSMSNLFATGRAFGVAAEFPYFEFQYESIFREKLESFNKSKIFSLSGVNLLPFSNIGIQNYHSEPNWNAPEFGAAKCIEDFCISKGADIILSGHGADSVFLTDPRKKSKTRLNFDSYKEFFIFESLDDKLISFGKNLKSDCEYFEDSSWSLEGLEPKYPNNSAHRCTPFSNEKFLSAMFYIANHYRYDLHRVQKPLAHLVFKDYIPESLWKRIGKVNHIGLMYRGLIKNSDDIIELFHREAEFIDFLGVKKESIINHLNEATHTGGKISELFYAIYACCIWRSSAQLWRGSSSITDPEAG